MKKEAWLAAVAGLLVAGTIATWFLSRPSPEGLATAARARALLDRASERVVFYTLHPRPRPVDGKTGNPDLHGWTVLQRKAIDDRDMVQRIRDTVSDARTYGGTPARCFEPGLAFGFEGIEAVDFVVCLACQQIACFKGGQRADLFVLSPSGNARLLALYKALADP